MQPTVTTICVYHLYHLLPTYIPFHRSLFTAPPPFWWSCTCLPFIRLPPAIRLSCVSFCSTTILFTTTDSLPANTLIPPLYLPFIFVTSVTFYLGSFIHFALHFTYHAILHAHSTLESTFVLPFYHLFDFVHFYRSCRCSVQYAVLIPGFYFCSSTVRRLPWMQIHLVWPIPWFCRHFTVPFYRFTDSPTTYRSDRYCFSAFTSPLPFWLRFLPFRLRLAFSTIRYHLLELPTCVSILFHISVDVRSLLRFDSFRLHLPFVLSLHFLDSPFIVLPAISRYLQSTTVISFYCDHFRYHSLITIVVLPFTTIFVCLLYITDSDSYRFLPFSSVPILPFLFLRCSYLLFYYHLIFISYILPFLLPFWIFTCSLISFILFIRFDLIVLFWVTYYLPLPVFHSYCSFCSAFSFYSGTFHSVLPLFYLPPTGRISSWFHSTFHYRCSTYISPTNIHSTFWVCIPSD